MPLYDYRCTACGRQVEVMHGVHASGPETCEACGAAMRKALSTPAIHFRGGGWAKKDAQAQRKARAGGGGKPAKGEESKPAAASGGEASAGASGDAAEASPKAAPKSATE